MSQITFSQAIQGYLLAVGARHLSTHTISDYANTFKKFTVFLGDDIPIEDITHNHIEAFSRRKPRSRIRLCSITIPGCHRCEYLVHAHVIRNVTPPKQEEREIVPFTLMEMRAMLAVVGRDAREM